MNEKLFGAYGDLGVNLLGAIGQGIAAYNNVNPLTGVQQAVNDIYTYGHPQYSAGDYGNLLQQRQATLNPAFYTGQSFYNPSSKERFGQILNSSIQMAQAGNQIGSNIENIIEESPAKSIKPTGLIDSTPQIPQNLPPSESRPTGVYITAFGGPLHHFSLGGDIGTMVGGAAGSILNTVANANQIKNANLLARQLNLANNAATRYNNAQFNTAVFDTGKMLQDGMLLNRRGFGGPLGTIWDNFTNGVRTINEGGTHEQNPLSGVPQGVAEDGQPNLVEEGEVIFNDYVYSNRLKLTDNNLKTLGLTGELTFADAAKKIQKESEERPNDSISQNTLRDSMQKLQGMQEEIKMKREQRQLKKLVGITMKNGGCLHKFDNGGEKNDFQKMYPYLEAERLAPIANAAAVLALQSTNKEQNQYFDEAIKAASSIPFVNYKPIANTFNPTMISPSEMTNPIYEQAAGVQRQIANSGMTRAGLLPTLLTLNRNSNAAIGDAYTKAVSANNALNQARAQMQMTADSTNAQHALQAAIQNTTPAQVRANALVGLAPARLAEWNAAHTIDANDTLTQAFADRAKEKETIARLSSMQGILYDYFNKLKK